MENHRPFFNPKPLKNMNNTRKTMPAYCVKKEKWDKALIFIVVIASF